jgi:hypothetical protein
MTTSTSNTISAFRYLSQLTELRELRLIDVTIDDHSMSLPLTLQCLTSLQLLTLDNVHIEDTSCGPVFDAFCNTLKSLCLAQFSLSSCQPQTNRHVFDLLKKLDTCHKILWKVDTVVEDSGECFIPFKRSPVNRSDEEVVDSEMDVMNMAMDDHFDDNEDNDEMSPIRYMDLTFLNELLQSELANTFIEIKPN